MLKERTFRLEASRQVFSIDRQAVDSAETMSQRRKRKAPAEDVVMQRARVLPKSMQLKIDVCYSADDPVNHDFSIVCSRDLWQSSSHFLQHTVIDEQQPIPTTVLPLDSTFPMDEVVEFFNLVESGNFKDTLHNNDRSSLSWKLSWVNLADRLQMDKVADRCAWWVWDGMDRIYPFVDWVRTTRLKSMEVRRPPSLQPTARPADVLSILCKDKHDDELADICAAQRDWFKREFGMDMLLDLLQKRG